VIFRGGWAGSSSPSLFSGRLSSGAGSVKRVSTSSRPSVVGRCTSIICTAANFSCAACPGASAWKRRANADRFADKARLRIVASSSGGNVVDCQIIAYGCKCELPVRPFGPKRVVSDNVYEDVRIDENQPASSPRVSLINSSVFMSGLALPRSRPDLLSGASG
jgi:hypothetical protein